MLEGSARDIQRTCCRIRGRAHLDGVRIHDLRHSVIAVAECELMLPRTLTKRLLNHARPSDVTEGYAADWTVEQLREPAQRMADRIDELMQGPEARPDWAAA